MIDALQHKFRDAAERCPHLWLTAASRLEGTSRPTYPDFREWATLLAPPKSGDDAPTDEPPPVGFPEPFAACWAYASGRMWQCGFHNGKRIEVPDGLGRRERSAWEVAARKERRDALEAGKADLARLAAEAVALFALSTARPSGWAERVPWSPADAALSAWLSHLVEIRAARRESGFHVVRFENAFLASAAALDQTVLPVATTPVVAAPAPPPEKPSSDWRKGVVPPWLLRAMVLLHDHPEMTDEEVARKVKQPLETLAADPRYREVVERSRAPAEDAPATAEPRPGDPIPGSQFFVEVCSICGERIRVPRSQVGTQPVCRSCAE